MLPSSQPHLQQSSLISLTDFTPRPQWAAARSGRSAHQAKALPVCSSTADSLEVTLLDYGAGNVRSLANTLTKLGYEFHWIACPQDFDKATVSPNPSCLMSSIHVSTK